MKITILGSSGFIGSNLKSFLNSKNCEVFTPTVDEMLLKKRDYGVVFYCIGLTSDFRERPFATIEAHVEKLNRILERSEFKKLVYLSSTRLYKNSKTTKEEDSILINPINSDSIYDISKALGESLCLNISNKLTCVVRLSNVIGRNQNSNTFLGQLLYLANLGKVTFESGPDSARDYISINDVSKILYKMAFQNNHDMYNIASGFNFENRELAKVLKSFYKCEVRFASSSGDEKIQEIDISRIKSEFNFEPESINNVFEDVFLNAE